MSQVISRRTLRRMIFMVRENSIQLLDRDERKIAEEVRNEFAGYLLGPMNWDDFTIKWDISPGLIDDDGMWSLRKKSIIEWCEQIIDIWEWKEWLREFATFNEQKYGKDHARKAIPPPCFTRQERMINGG